MENQKKLLVSKQKFEYAGKLRQQIHELQKDVIKMIRPKLNMKFAKMSVERLVELYCSKS